MQELEASKTNLTSKLTALVSDLGNLDTQVDKFLAPGTGIAAISHDIVNASSSESYPSSSQLSTTANGGAGTASIAQLIDPASPMVRGAWLAVLSLHTRSGSPNGWHL